MKKQPPTHRRQTPLWLAAIAAVAAPWSAQSEERIRYTFEEFTSDPLPDDVVLNTAPDAFDHPDILDPGAPANPNGLWNITGFPIVLQDEIVSFQGGIYNLGTSVDFRAGDYIHTGYFTDELFLDGASDYTAMAWINVLDATGDHMVFGTLAGDQRLHLGTRAGNLHSGHWGDDLSATGANDPGTWHHVAWVGQASGIQQIYKDGELVPDDGGGTGATPNNPVVDELLIGIAEAPGRGYSGALDEVKYFDTLLTQEEIRAAAVEGLEQLPIPGIESITSLSRTAVEIVLVDFDASSAVDPNTVQLEIEFVGPVTPDSVDKIGDKTFIVYTSPTEPAPYELVTFIVDAQTTGGAAFSHSTSIRTFAFPSQLRTGLAAPPADGSWIMSEWVGATIGAGEQAYRDALATIANDPIDDPNFFFEAVVPYVNHGDPDSPGGRGQFHPDLPILSDLQGTDDNNYVTLARSILTIDDTQVGPHTIHIQGDDGYGIRITNTADPANDPTFTGKAGAAENVIDLLSPNTALFPIPTGNSNAYLNIDFPVAGTYLVEFVSYELGGGAYQEISWVQGTFTAFNQSPDWRLMGDGSPYETVSTRGEIPQALLDELEALEPDVTGWKTKIFYGADRAGDLAVDNLDEAMDFLRQFDAGTATSSGVYTGTVPTLNFTDGADGDFGGGTLWPLPTDGGTDTIDDFILLACATIRVTEEDDYTIRVRTDDGFMLRFLDPSITFTSEFGASELHPGSYSELLHPANTGNSDALGVVHLPAGDHQVAFVFWERGGGANAEIAAARGVHETFTAQNFTLIGDPIDFTPKPVVTGIDTTGQWTVTATDPPDADGFLAGDLAAGFVRGKLDAATNVSSWDNINFADPQSPGGGAAVPDAAVPFPNDTPADDDQFAIGGTAEITIPTDGDYLFGFQGDDGAFLRLVGQNFPIDAVLEGAGVIDEGDFTNAPGVFDRIINDIATGNSRTVAYIPLTAGTYTLEFEFFEIAGGGYHAVFGAPSPFAADLLDYEPGIVMIPIGVGAASQSHQGVSGGLELAPHNEVVVEDDDFRIRTIFRDPADFAIELTFDSEPGTNYNIAASLDGKDWTISVGDTTGAADPATTTTVRIPLSEIINAFGIVPDDVLFRVEVAP